WAWLDPEWLEPERADPEWPPPAWPPLMLELLPPWPPPPRPPPRAKAPWGAPKSVSAPAVTAARRTSSFRIGPVLSGPVISCPKAYGPTGQIGRPGRKCDRFLSAFSACRACIRAAPAPRLGAARQASHPGALRRSAPGRNRTLSLTVRSRLLYPLSYGGKRNILLTSRRRAPARSTPRQLGAPHSRASLVRTSAAVSGGSAAAAAIPAR